MMMKIKQRITSALLLVFCPQLVQCSGSYSISIESDYLSCNIVTPYYIESSLDSLFINCKGSYLSNNDDLIERLYVSSFGTPETNVYREKQLSTSGSAQYNVTCMSQSLSSANRNEVIYGGTYSTAISRSVFINSAFGSLSVSQLTHNSLMSQFNASACLHTSQGFLTLGSRTSDTSPSVRGPYSWFMDSQSTVSGVQYSVASLPKDMRFVKAIINNFNLLTIGQNDTCSFFAKWDMGTGTQTIFKTFCSDESDGIVVFNDLVYDNYNLYIVGYARGPFMEFNSLLDYGVVLKSDLNGVASLYYRYSTYRSQFVAAAIHPTSLVLHVTGWRQFTTSDTDVLLVQFNSPVRITAYGSTRMEYPTDIEVTQSGHCVITGYSQLSSISATNGFILITTSSGASFSSSGVYVTGTTKTSSTSGRGSSSSSSSILPFVIIFPIFIIIIVLVSVCMRMRLMSRTGIPMYTCCGVPIGNHNIHNPQAPYAPSAYGPNAASNPYNPYAPQPVPAVAAPYPPGNVQAFSPYASAPLQQQPLQYPPQQQYRPPLQPQQFQQGYPAPQPAFASAPPMGEDLPAYSAI
ncbi:hypothetical protein MIR68_001621 [Amoeboaphelidium protococcarum]|nr:hypothetical protein MIR68_001621 [Amoeboaphelidium protococcarum]